MDDRGKERLIKLLQEMQGEFSIRAFARHLKIGYASLSAYMLGDSFPEARNLEKIAHYKGWTREELEAYLGDRPFERSRTIDDILKEVRAMSPQEAMLVARAALDRVESAL
jgi:transcriptional regulator with XRE-family HTH domain